jgi:hypothetical protein
MIEEMLRDGYSEREIERAVRRASGDPEPPRPSITALALAWVRGLRGK